MNLVDQSRLTLDIVDSSVNQSTVFVTYFVRDSTVVRYKCHISKFEAKTPGIFIQKRPHTTYETLNSQISIAMVIRFFFEIKLVYKISAKITLI